jgi:hypothetical protein
MQDAYRVRMILRAVVLHIECPEDVSLALQEFPGVERGRGKGGETHLDGLFAKDLQFLERRSGRLAIRRFEPHRRERIRHRHLLGIGARCDLPRTPPGFHGVVDRSTPLADHIPFSSRTTSKFS